MENTLLSMLLVPAAGGFVALCLNRRASWLAHLITLGVMGWLFVNAVRLPPGLRVEREWMRIGPVEISLECLVTGFGAVLCIFIAAFGFLLALYSVGYSTGNVGKHNAFMLWAVAGALGAALANNLIFFLISWEIVTLMLYMLINLGGEKAKAGAAKTFAILGFSDCAMLLAVVLIAVTHSAPTLAMDKLQLSADSPLTVLCFLLFVSGALAKAGATPLHTWIPAAAEGAPTDVMALLPASLDKLLGIYLLARTALQFFVLGTSLKILLMIIGAVTIIGAVMMAMIQHDLKKLFAFHAVSQVGYMVLGIGTGSLIGVAGALFHMINNTIYKSCLFLTAGAVEKSARTTDLDRLGGLAGVMPFTFIGCFVAALAISGVPPLNGFASKWLIYQATLAVPSRIAPALVAAAVFGSALTLASFVKVLHGVFLGVRPVELAEMQPREASPWMVTPILVLAFLCVAFGLAAPWALGRFIAPAMDTVGLNGLEAHLAEGKLLALSTLWSPARATVLLLSALVLGLIIYGVGTAFNVRRSRMYVGGEKIATDTAQYSGTEFYKEIPELPGIKGIYRDAQREAFDVYHIGGRFGGSLVEGLRRSQTGVLTLYVSWVILGLLIMIAYLVGLPGPGS